MYSVKLNNKTMWVVSSTNKAISIINEYLKYKKSGGYYSGEYSGKNLIIYTGVGTFFIEKGE